jgi:hypothetical protein
LSAFKDITLVKNLKEKEPLKCQNLVEKLKSFFEKQKVKIALLNFIL